MCGQGDEQPFLNRSKNIKYLPPLHGTARSDYLNELTAVICPSLYVEPFCGVNVEAQLCGVPVIASDHGAFTETIENFKTVLVCHTIPDFCHGVEMAINRELDRQYIREKEIEK